MLAKHIKNFRLISYWKRLLVYIREHTLYLPPRLMVFYDINQSKTIVTVQIANDFPKGLAYSYILFFKKVGLK